MSPVAEEGAATSPTVTGPRAKRSQHPPRRKEADAGAAARERVDAIVKREAAKTIGQVGYVQRKVADEAAARELAREEATRTTNQIVFGSIVTYSAGLDVSKLITGFETCTIRFANLPLDVKEDDIHALLRDHSIDIENLHLVFKKDCGLEVHIVADIANGQAIALTLDGVEFREEPLVVEMSATNSLDGMDATTGQGSDILTISWRAPAARYVAEYVDVPAAKAKVAELNRFSLLWPPYQSGE
ncbi:hypothetical protein JVU11DRAFT_7135 [Chiua virens]|nr:hypothetical protein JVU11DRAFT_7135 [Chiua virens]